MVVLAGYLGSMLPVSDANMFVYGFVPHSGPSTLAPVTGTPACSGYFAAAVKSGLTETIPNVPLEIAD